MLFRSSGVDVSKEAFNHHAMGLIVTHGQDKRGCWGTNILGPGNPKFVGGNKDSPETWEKVTEIIADYLSKGDGNLMLGLMTKSYGLINGGKNEK